MTEREGESSDPVAAFLTRVNEVLAEQGRDLVGYAAPATVAVCAVASAGAVGAVAVSAEVVSATTFHAEVAALIGSPPVAVPRSTVTKAALVLAAGLGTNLIYDIIDPDKVIAQRTHEALAEALDKAPLAWDTVVALARLAWYYLNR